MRVLRKRGRCRRRGRAVVSRAVRHDEHPIVVNKLSLLDRLLPVWIGAAMAAGLLLGRLVRPSGPR